MNVIFQKEKFFLASKSPRRKQLLEEAGFSFEVIPLDVDESYPAYLGLKNVPEYIAKKKARAGRKKIPDDGIVIAADSVVIHKSQIFEKPQSREEAVEMLQKLSGNQHLVVSGVCILKASREISFSSTTRVRFGNLSFEEINYYLDTYKPFDKAGSYGIQEWLGYCKVESIEGSYTNVMGLPMYELYHNLIRFIKA